MLERRDFTPQELLAWNRFLSLVLLGSALAFIREREGSLDEFVGFAAGRLGTLWSGIAGGGTEPALLALLLNVQAAGADLRADTVNPEEGEVVVSDLPGDTLYAELEDRFEVVLRPDDLLALAGVSQEELNRLLDVFGAAVGGGDFEYRRQPEGDGQRLTLRRW